SFFIFIMMDSSLPFPSFCLRSVPDKPLRGSWRLPFHLITVGTVRQIFQFPRKRKEMHSARECISKDIKNG
ncbi:MAG: hypothetical protein PUG02_05230, partial [Selenomonadaceae bacterium]|nr:hypothetical protein [Selenomonadaceae bacterium]